MFHWNLFQVSLGIVLSLFGPCIKYLGDLFRVPQGLVSGLQRIFQVLTRLVLSSLVTFFLFHFRFQGKSLSNMYQFHCEHFLFLSSGDLSQIPR
jgi:hypothetical protein